MLDGCSQIVNVTLRVGGRGLLVVSGPAIHWWTKSENLAPGVGPNPPFIKGKLSSGVWVKLSAIRRAGEKYSMFFASSSCPGVSLPFKWNASTVTVTTVAA